LETAKPRKVEGSKGTLAKVPRGRAKRAGGGGPRGETAAQREQTRHQRLTKFKKNLGDGEKKGQGLTGKGGGYSSLSSINVFPVTGNVLPKGGFQESGRGPPTNCRKAWGGVSFDSVG